MLREEAIPPPIAQGVSLPILDELRSGISKDLLHLTAIQYNSINAGALPSSRRGGEPRLVAEGRLPGNRRG
jgi:hypothetical protein